MANPNVTVSAVPFNPQTQTFGSTPTQTNQQNPNVVPGTNYASIPSTYTQNQNDTLMAFNQKMVTPVAPTNIPQSQNIDTFSTQKINFPQTNLTQIQPTQNYAANYAQNIPTPVADTASRVSEMMLKLIPQTVGQSQEFNSQLTAQDYNKKLQAQQDTSNLILQKQAELNQNDISLAQGLQNIEDQAIPMQFITGQQLSVQNRANLARALKVSEINMLNAQSLAQQGNLTLARQIAQDAVNTKYGPVIEMYNTLQAQLQAMQPLLNSEEKRVAAQQTAITDIQKQILTNKQNQETKFMDMLMKAPTDIGATPDQIGKAISVYNQTGDPIKALAGLTGADQYVQQYQTQDATRNAVYNGVGQLTVDNGYDLNAFKKGIAGVESSNNYNAIGPTTKSGDQAYGKYQVMGVNIPSWTKEALGYSMTPQQFLKSPDAQEKVFEFQSMKNYSKYGNWDDVASVWFSGRPLSNNTSSDGYNTVPQYLQKYRNNMGVPIQNTVVTSPSVIVYAKDVQQNQDNMKYVPKALIPQVLAYNQQNPVTDGQPVTKEEQAKFLIDTIVKAESYANASGRSSGRKLVESWTVGATDYTNLESQIRTIKTNLLTLATDPNIKKFFGPQMTEADVRNMQAAASTLDPEGQSPQNMKDELARAKQIFQKFVPGYDPKPLDVWSSNLKNIFFDMSTTTNSHGYN